jgi:hypothetical protein
MVGRPFKPVPSRRHGFRTDQGDYLVGQQVAEQRHHGWSSCVLADAGANQGKRTPDHRIWNETLLTTIPAR